MNSQLIKKIVEIDSEIKEIKEELHEFNSKYMTRTDFHNVMDPIVVILKRLDTERAATAEWMKRIQTTTDRHEKDIKIIKEKIF